ncbi:MAG TPA: hypothetical protein VFB59_02365 [Candidatus Saccharimonadales bacterium]|nr:hypothetical protein [Candidatus Saccharimonadales bacterium]
MGIQPEKIQEVYQFLTAGNQPLPQHIDMSVVFGRKSKHLQNAVLQAVGRSDGLILCGGIDADAGDLRFYQNTADYLLGPLIHKRYSYPAEWRVDIAAKSGIEHAQRSVQFLNDLGKTNLETVAGISHPTRSLRLGGLLRAEMQRNNLNTDGLIHHGSDYPFDPENLFDQYEAAREVVRIDSYKEDGRRSYLVIPERPTQGMVQYAKGIMAQLGADFKRQGIKNASTADDTNRFESPFWKILNSSHGGRMDAVVECFQSAYLPMGNIVNGFRLGRAALKELRARAGM